MAVLLEDRSLLEVVVLCKSIVCFVWRHKIYPEGFVEPKNHNFFVTVVLMQISEWEKSAAKVRRIYQIDTGLRDCCLLPLF